MAHHVLLVEGNGDQDFFNAYCKLLGMAETKVNSPKDLNASTGNGWSNLVTNLPILLNQIKAGDVDQFGIVLDADYPPENNGGFAKRFQLVADELVKVGYTIPQNPSYKTGEIFTHSDGLPPIGLWIMPDHQSDGMLEGFVEYLISDTTQIALLTHAEQSINNLPVTLFNKTLHLTKAKVFTWRAWQRPPGLPLSKVLETILDRSKAVNFENWLKKVFK